MALRRIALRYMTEFRCIGPECEDTCCGGWSIHIDQGHHARLRKVMARDPQEQALFERQVALRPGPERTRAWFATMTLLPDRNCPMLDGDRLCRIQRRHGEELLPDVCAQYPRYLAQVGGRLELSGLLSCPEVARRALLAPDATELCEVGAGPLGRGVVAQDLGNVGLDRADRACVQHLDEVRGTLYELLSRPRFSLSARLYFLAQLADCTDLLFAAARDPGQAFDQARFRAELERFGREEVLAALEQDLGDPAAAETAALPALLLVLQVLGDQGLPHPALRRVLRRALEGYAAEPGAGVEIEGAEGRPSFQPRELLRSYRRRRAAITEALGERVDLYCHNYARHFCIKEWHFDAADLRTHVQALLLRLAIQRFLLFSQPAALGAGREEMDRLAVEVFYSFNRALEHTPGFLAALSRASEDRHLGRAVALIAL